MHLQKIVQQFNQALEQKKSQFVVKTTESTWFFNLESTTIMLGVVGVRVPLLTILEKIALTHAYNIHTSYVGKNLQLSLNMPIRECTPHVLLESMLCLYRIAHEH